MPSGHCHCTAVSWRLRAVPETATACNCSVCRRYGALWAYGWDAETIHTAGSTHVYTRGDHIGFHFCPDCGCLVFYRALHPDAQGRHRLAANLRMAVDADGIADLPVRHFDGLHRFAEMPFDGRTVRDLWF